MAKIHNHISCQSCSIFSRSIFSAYTNDELKKASFAKKCWNYKKGETIFAEGEEPHYIYCINKGSIKLTRLNNSGKEQIIHLAKEGDILGFRAVLSNDMYSCSAVALEETCLCAIPKKLFLETAKNNPPVAFKLIEVFAQKLKATEQGMALMATANVKERVCKALLLLVEAFGLEEDGKTIKTKISREDFAQLAGTTRETATRTLFELQKESLVLLNKKNIQILNFHKIQNKFAHE